MFFYHFTQKRNVDSILVHGVNLGLTPYRDISDVKAVSLTSVPDPKGHGLISGEILSENEPEYSAAAARYPEGVKVGVNWQSRVEMFDQTEAMVVFDLNLSSSKLISHQQLFDKILTNGVMRGRSKQELNYWNAAIILAASYPFGLAHVSMQQIESERQAIMNGQREHNAASWYFHLDTISPKTLLAVRFKQSNGLYL